MRLERCVCCGREGATVIYDGKFFCIVCTNNFNTCAMCVHSKNCEFDSNPAPIPKMVVKKIRQQTEHGYMEQIVQVPNPQRVKALCLDGECVCCKTCEDEKVRCLRQFGVCENYEEIEF